MDYCSFKTCVKNFNQIVLTNLCFSYYHRNIEFDNICHSIVIFTLKILLSVYQTHFCKTKLYINLQLELKEEENQYLKRNYGRGPGVRFDFGVPVRICGGTLEKFVDMQYILEYSNSMISFSNVDTRRLPKQ